MAETVDFFLVIGLIILIGFFGRIFRERTGIPESLFLIMLGIILGPITNFFDIPLLLGFVPILSVFALVVILLEAGTSLNIQSIMKSVSRSLIFTLLTAILITASVAFLLSNFFGYSLSTSLLIGILSSGTTTITVVAMLDRLQAPKPVKNLLTIESIVNDFTAIVGTFLVLDFIDARSLDVTGALQSIFGDIFAALITGFLAALLWQHALIRLNVRDKISYMSTLGAAFVTYYLGFLTGANPIIAVFIFGLSLGNMKTIADMLNLKIGHFNYILKSIHHIQPDISFFVRTFFFVILGIIFNPGALTISIIAVVITISTVVILMRYFASTLLSYWDIMFKENRDLISIMIPRGFAATILAFVPQQYGINIPFLSDIVLLLVFTTTLVAIVGTSFYAHLNKKNKDKK